MQADIVGKGAIGLLLASDLIASGCACRLLLREAHPKPFEVIRLSDKTIKVQVPQLTPDAKSTSHTPADVLILPVKSFQVAEALRQWQWRIGPDTIIVILCNGIGLEQIICDMLPHNPVVRGTTSRAALKNSATQVQETGNGDTLLGWLNTGSLSAGNDKATDTAVHQAKIQDRLSSILSGARWQEDIDVILWKKVAINAVINTLTSIHDIPNGRLSEPVYQPDITELLTEIATLFLAMKLPLSQSELTDTVARVIINTAENYSSMHQDIVTKQRTEIDYITGQLLSQADNYGIMMPRNRQLYQQIKALELQHQSPTSKGHL